MPITSSSQTFASFFDEWLIRHRHFVEHLIRVSSLDNTNHLTPLQEESIVTQFLSHCLQYFEEKSAAVSIAGDDIYDFFFPPWLTSYEKIILWVGGFKPGMVFKLVTASVHDLTSHQKEQLENIGSETKRRERDLMRGFALVQQSVADPPLMLATRRVGAVGLVDGEQSDMEDAMEVLKAEMTRVMNNADQLRCWTVGKVVEILNSRQAIKLLRSAGELHLRLRELGIQRDYQIA